MKPAPWPNSSPLAPRGTAAGGRRPGLPHRHRRQVGVVRPGFWRRAVDIPACVPIARRIGRRGKKDLGFTCLFAGNAVIEPADCLLPSLFCRLDQHLGRPTRYCASYLGAFVPMSARFFKRLKVLWIPHIERPAHQSCLHFTADGTPELRHKLFVEPLPELVRLQKSSVAEVRPVPPVPCAQRKHAAG